MTAQKISAEELAALQALVSEVQMADARLQGAMRLLATIHKLPNDSQIDPLTGEIKLPQPKADEA